MIKSRDTKPEMTVRRYLFGKGFRYRINVKQLYGKPDIVFSKYKVAIFINGCFWHGHENCSLFVLPKTKTEWWKNKIEKTKIRDSRNKAILKEKGWNVLTVWECQLKKKNRNETLMELSDILSKIILEHYKR